MKDKVRFPSWRYHANQKACIVRTPEEDEALGHGWTNSPATVNDVPVEEVYGHVELAEETTFVDEMDRETLCEEIKSLGGAVDGRNSDDTLRATLRALIEAEDGDSS